LATATPDEFMIFLLLAALDRKTIAEFEPEELLLSVGDRTDWNRGICVCAAMSTNVTTTTSRRGISIRCPRYRPWRAPQHHRH
jgi:hypothetical protein